MAFKMLARNLARSRCHFVQCPFFSTSSARAYREPASLRKVFSYATIHCQTDKKRAVAVTEHSICQCRFSSASASPKRKEIVQFNLADIGEGINEVIVKEWFVKVGDHVSQFDSICEVQSDKASVTITSRFDGIITKIHYEIDDTAKVGQPLVDIETEGEGDDAGELVDQVNDQVARKQPILEQKHILEQQPVAEQQRQEAENESWRSYKKSLATPAVRRLAQENDLRLPDIKGTGKDGRVLKEDVLKYLETLGAQKRMESHSFGSKAAASAKEEPIRRAAAVKETAKAGIVRQFEDRTENISPFIKGMIKTMTQALKIPHFGLGDEIDMSKLVAARPLLKSIGQQHELNISYMPFFIKAASMALTEYPILNASLIEAQEPKIVYKGSHNIGVAMDTPNGLLVPNIKDVQSLSIIEIARELNRLQELGKKGQLSNKDLSGGTFTLSNIGSIGGEFGIPVIMPPEVAIGAIGRVVQVPKFDDNGQIVKASVIKVTWSADHRIIDGATMTRFNNNFKSYIEDPMSMVFHLA